MTERILVVEDEANIASFVSAYLERPGSPSIARSTARRPRRRQPAQTRP